MKTVAQVMVCLFFTQVLWSQSSRKVEVGNFKGIGNSVAADITIKKGNTCQIEVISSEEYFNKIEFIVENNTLKIKSKKKNYYSGENSNMRINITMPSLESISSAGSGDIEVESEFDSQEFSISSAGSGNISVKGGSFGVLKISSAGSGDIVCNGGKAETATLSSAGSGDINTAGTTTETVKCSSAGSGNITCWATKDLKVSSVGSGDVKYKGNPNVKSSSLGSGGVHAMH